MANHIFIYKWNYYPEVYFGFRLSETSQRPVQRQKSATEEKPGVSCIESFTYIYITADSGLFIMALFKLLTGAPNLHT